MITPDQLEAELRAFLDHRLPRRRQSGDEWGGGDDAVMDLGTARGEAEAREVEEAKAFQAALWEAGLAWIDGPTELGGRGLGPEHAARSRRVLAGYVLPNQTPFIVAHHIVGPTVLAHGSPEQRQRWLPGIWRGETLCCQLFSEPNAGSDLASLRTRATRDGDDWVITGQKLWSSGAHYSQVGEILCRTGSEADRHRSITAFLVPMDSPGLTVRPLRQMNGAQHFNEVFLDGVRVADANRLGPVNGGWAVAMSTLGNERSLLSEENSAIIKDPVRRLINLARHTGAASDPGVRELIADAWIREQLLLTLGARAEAEPDPIAPPASVIKLVMTDNLQRYIDLAGRLLGSRMAVDNGEWGTYAWAQVALGAPAQRIAGGTDEIQRNILAERVLGLPRDARPATPQEKRP